jgi:hypothetical protein
MPLMRVSDPIHEWVMEQARIRTQILGRTVTVSEVMESLVTLYNQKVEEESA